MSKKIYITESQFNDLVEEGKKPKKNNKGVMDYVKADRRARREEAREMYGDGFKSNTRVTPSDKKYSRKGKQKFKYGNTFDND